MNFSYNFITLILLYVIQKTCSQGTTRVPGVSSCLYVGAYEIWCGLAPVPVSSLPKECTSFLFYGLISHADYTITPGLIEDKFEEHVKDLLDSGKPVFDFYGHPSLTEWAAVVATNTEDGGVQAKAEVESIKAYIGGHKGLTGLILNDLGLESGSPDCANFTPNFKVFIDELRSSLPDLGIGIELMGTDVIDYYDSSKLTWLDFKMLDPVVDFYVISVYFFNPYSDEFRIGGITPLNGNAPYTMDKLLGYLVNAGIPKSKLYFLYGAIPTSSNPDFSICDLTNEKLCASPSPSDLCSDTQKSYREKGTYAKDNGAGFAAFYVDLDDANGCCNCGGPYPAFRSLLDGFNGADTSKPCPLFDKS